MSSISHYLNLLEIMKTEGSQEKSSSRKTAPSTKHMRRTNHSTSNEKRTDVSEEPRHRQRLNNPSASKLKIYKGQASHEAGDNYETVKHTDRLKRIQAQQHSLEVTDTKKRDSSSSKVASEALREHKLVRKSKNREGNQKRTEVLNDNNELRKGGNNMNIRISNEKFDIEHKDVSAKKTSHRSGVNNEPYVSVNNQRQQEPGNANENSNHAHSVMNETDQSRKPSDKQYKKLSPKRDGKTKPHSNENMEIYPDSIRLKGSKKEISDIEEIVRQDRFFSNDNDIGQENLSSQEKDLSGSENYTSDFDDAALSSDSSGISSQQEVMKDTTITSYYVAADLQSDHRAESSTTVQLIDFNRSIMTSGYGLNQRLKQRANDLKRLIELEFDNCISIFDLRPLDEYSNYMLRFGQANRCQAQTQTQEDALEREVQTELIEYCSGGGIWTQWPPLDSGNCTGKVENANEINSFTTTSLQHNLEYLSDPYLDDVIKDFSYNSATRSVLKQSKRGTHTIPHSLLPKIHLMLAILSEERIPELVESACERHIGSDSESFTQGQLNLDNENSGDELVEPQPSLPGDSGCVACAFAPFNGDTLLTVHRPTRVPMGNRLIDRTGYVHPAGEVIYIWSISSGSGTPKHQLHCPGLSETGFRGANITCAIFSPDADASMVIGGLADGSICVWDLRDSHFGVNALQVPLSTCISSSPSGGTQTSKRTRITYSKAPIYSTSGVDFQQITSSHAQSSKLKLPEMEPVPGVRSNTWHEKPHKVGQEQNYRVQNRRHSMPIVDVQLIPSAQQKTAISNFQIAVLDISGELSLWMVLRPKISTINNLYELLAGSQTDLGLRPAERVVQVVCLAYLVPSLKCFSEESFNWPMPDRLEGGNITVDDPKLPLRTRPNINATSLAVSNLGDFLVGFSNGAVVKLTRSANQLVYPRQFVQPSNKAAIRCVAVHPNREFKVLIAGYADGYIRLFHFNCPDALCEWNLSEQRDCQLSAVKLVWSQTRPAVFFCLDSSGRIISWDLVKGLASRYTSADSVEPIEYNITGSDRGMEIHVPTSKTDQNRVYDFALSQGVLVNSSGQIQIMAAFALIYPEAVKIHWLDAQWSHATGEDLAKTKRLFERLFEER